MLIYRLILAVFLLPLAALAQLTTVTGTLSDAMGAVSPKLTATMSFRPGATFTSSSGWVVPGSIPRTVPVTNGAFSVGLVPTANGWPVTYYEVRAAIPLQTAAGVSCAGNMSLIAAGACVVGPLEWGPVYLSVPSAPSTIDWKDYYVTSRPAAPLSLVWVWQFHPDDFTEGVETCLKKMGGIFTAVECGSVSSVLSWSGLISGQWSGLTAPQWASLAP